MNLKIVHVGKIYRHGTTGKYCMFLSHVDGHTSVKKFDTKVEAFGWRSEINKKINTGD